MKVLVVGSIALDTVKTPFGVLENGLGGSAVYASVSASYFTKVGLVGVVGEDFPKNNIDILKKKKIDISGLQTINNGLTFRWSGVYEDKDLNSAITLKTDLNVFADFRPKLPDNYKNIPYIFLGNIHPSLQLYVVKQLKSPKLVILDSMNLWINTTLEDLLKVIKRSNIVLLNEIEAKMLCCSNNLVCAAKRILSMGPNYVIIKKGEHGAMLFSKKGAFIVPAFPLDKVIDPTGAGDSFAGGLVGYIASKNKVNDEIIKQALVVGSAMASFNVQNFSLKGLLSLKKSDIKSRLKMIQKLSSFQLPQF